MRDATNLKITGLILHILEPLGQKLVLSDVPLPVAEFPELVDYFTGHLAASLQDETLKAARFCGEPLGSSGAICAAMLDGTLEFSEGSRRLASSLYNILAADKRISPADLAVCTFTAANYPGKSFLGLLKIDPSQVFRNVSHTRPDGTRFIAFEIESGAFTRERLQKAAFVRPLSPLPADYHLLLLDRQVSGAQAAGVARFFARDFLDTEEAFDARERTRRLYSTLIDARNLLRPQLNARQDEDLSERIRLAVTSGEINLDDWLLALPLPLPLRQQLNEIVSTQLPDRAFQLDRSFADRMVKKVIFRGDGGLKVVVDSSEASRLIKEVVPHNDPGRPPYYRIVIETESWVEVTR